MSKAKNSLIEAIQESDPKTDFATLVGAVESGDLPEVIDAAARFGNVEAIKAIAASGRVNLDVFDDFSNTPLTTAARNGHLEVVRFLLKAGANVNAHEGPKMGNTVLREVVYDAPLALIEMLLEYGADPTIPGWMQLTAVDKAEERVAEQGTSEANSVMDALRKAVKAR